MPTRTTQSIVRFDPAFILASLDTTLPAGKYLAEQDDQLIEGVSWLARQHISTLMHIPAIGTGKPVQRMLQTDPAELETAIEKDHRQL